MARQGARRTAGRRFWNDPVLQFVAAGVVALVVLLVGAAWLSERAARREAVDDAEATAELLVRSVVEPGVPSGLDDGRSAALDRFDRLIRGRVLSDEVLRIKVWAADGQIVYSDKTQVIGERFELEPDELEILVEGGSDAEASDLTAPENRYERPFGELVEVYTRVVDPDGTPLLFEAYFSADEIRERGAEVRSAFRPITVGGLALFLACTIPIVWLLARRLDAAADDRERLLLAAADASDAERRRIARDLHDGVVQDLAGASFELSAAARDARAVPQLAGTLEGVGASVRHSLRSLRSLLVEIYPPELRTAGLAAALDDLVAPAIASGIDVVLTVDDTAELDDDVVALVWRAAQEAVRNAVRHGSPTRLAITVTVRPSAVTLTVADDGVGFDPSVPGDDGHLGLRVVRDLVAESGGTFDVRSAAGAGTTVTVEVPAS